MERETQRNVEVIWLTRKLMLKDKTIAVFCRENREAVRALYRDSARLCPECSMQARPEKIEPRTALAEHPFGTLNHRMDQRYFLMRGLNEREGGGEPNDPGISSQESNQDPGSPEDDRNSDLGRAYSRLQSHSTSTRK